MNSRILLAAASAAMFAVPAFAADSATGTIGLNASVPDTCYISSMGANSLATGGAFTAPGAGGATVSATLDLGTTAIADATTAVGTSATYIINVEAYCNYASHNVSLQSLNGGLIGPDSASVPSVGDFERRINYTADFAGWDGSTATSLTTDGVVSSAAADVDSATQAYGVAVNTVGSAATLTITTADGTDPLIAGAYADTLTLQFGAAL